MIVFVQPFGLNSPGGGPRILRSLLQEAPVPLQSICVSMQPPPPTTIGQEHWVPSRPAFGGIERTRFSRGLGRLYPAYAGRCIRQIESICQEGQATALHAIPQGPDFWYAFQAAQRLNLPYYLTVHDLLEYNLANRPEKHSCLNWLAIAWRQARACMVISLEMGEELCRRYGSRPYTVVTDGLNDFAAQPRPSPANSLRVYFGGALHHSYQPNCRALVNALRLIKQRNPALNVTLTVRSGPVSDPEGVIPIHLLPWGTEADVARDLAEADLLYLPLPFGERYEAFSKFSLSTKMVTYLGSGLPILYHGPEDAAAGRLLAAHRAAIMLDSLESECIAKVLSASMAQTADIVHHALMLGQDQFRLPQIRQRFWQTIGEI